MPMVSGLNLQVAEMQDHIHNYDKSIFAAYAKLDRLEKIIDSIQKDIKDLQQGEEEKHYHNNEKEKTEMARKRKLDGNITTEEEKVANHTMVLHDLTDCKYCIEKNKNNFC